MKANYYEILDITPFATAEEIEAAYRQACNTYGGESLAAYSLYSAEEKEAFLKDINAAYETLKDPLKKRQYDSRLSSAEREAAPEFDSSIFRGGASNEAPLLNTSPRYRTVRLKQPLVVMGDMASMVLEQYSILYTKIEQIGLRNSFKTFAVTSAVKQEGKSVTSLNLAYVMANDFRKKSLLFECDLRKNSTLSANLDTDDARGLTDVLKGDADPKEVIRCVEGTGLHVLPAGKLAGKSPELLNSARLKSLLNGFKTEFDYIIVDSPPIIPLVDMSIISRLVDGIVIVVRAGKTPKDIVLKAINSLSNTNVVGVVLNGTNSRMKNYYY